MTNKTTEKPLFRKTLMGDVDSLKKLWQSSFDEDERAASLIFDKYFDLFDGFCAELDGEIAAALYLVGGNLCGRRAHYLCGAATDRRRRGEGLMTALVKFALEKAKEDGDVFSILFPANDGLYEFYRRFGYTRLRAAEIKVSRGELETLGNAKSTGIFTGKSSFEYGLDFIGFASEYYEVYGARTAVDGSAFIAFEEESNAARVVSSAGGGLPELCELLTENSNAERFFMTVCVETQTADAETVRYGMIKSLDCKTKPPENAFIGITLD